MGVRMKCDRRTNLDVSMYQLCRVQVFQSAQDLIHEILDVFDSQHLLGADQSVKIGREIVLEWNNACKIISKYSSGEHPSLQERIDVKMYLHNTQVFDGPFHARWKDNIEYAVDLVTKKSGKKKITTKLCCCCTCGCIVYAHFHGLTIASHALHSKWSVHLVRLQTPACMS